MSRTLLCFGIPCENGWNLYIFRFVVRFLQNAISEALTGRLRTT